MKNSLTGNRTNGFHRSLAANKFIAVSTTPQSYSHLDVELTDEVGRAPADCTSVEPAGINQRGILTFTANITLKHGAKIASVALLDADGIVLYEANCPTPVTVPPDTPTPFTLEVSV